MNNQRVWKFLWYILILLTLITSNLGVTSETKKISSNCFQSTNGTLDTGYRSQNYSNESVTVEKAVTFKVSNVTQNSISLSSSEYKTNWYYIQTNLFRTNFTRENNVSKIEVVVNPEGYLSNVTTIVWRLSVESLLNDPLSVCVSLTQIINGIILIAPLTEDKTNDETNSSSSRLEILPFVFTITFAILFVSKKGRKNQGR